MTKHRTTPVDDADAFREAVKDVQPLPDQGRVVHPPARPTPLPRQREQDDRQVLADSLSDQPPLEAELESGEALAFLRQGLSPQVLRKLRSGFWAVQDELDLHGLRTEEARELLAQFLTGAVRRGHRCLRVIHGKGWRSRNNEPVLKRKVAGWLTQRGEVLALIVRRAPQTAAAARSLCYWRREARGARREARTPKPSPDISSGRGFLGRSGRARSGSTVAANRSFYWQDGHARDGRPERAGNRVTPKPKCPALQSSRKRLLVCICKRYGGGLVKYPG
jgi:DNA-nicking Smr family endonuclease